ncbi:hypothetical protein [Streptomyces chartreusis]|uniref:hypothetical protein n=1 Tax=Streptomyces chartreusis TaxID=1969 RepID=UPI0034124272
MAHPEMLAILPVCDNYAVRAGFNTFTWGWPGETTVSQSVNPVSGGRLIAMVRRGRKAGSAAEPLVRPQVQIGRFDGVAAVGKLRGWHESAGDPEVERMPADDEIYGALLYTERNAGALRTLPLDVQRAAALERVRLWEYMRERADVHQARAVANARAVGAAWLDLAPALAVRAASAAYNKARRLRAALLSDDTPDAPPVRRTPEAVEEAERRIALRNAAEQREQEAARQRNHLLMPVARRLLEQREALGPDEDAEYWFDEMAEVLPSCVTPTQMVSLERYLDAALRVLSKLEQRTACSVASTEAAQAALAAARQWQTQGTPFRAAEHWRK